MEQSKPKIFTRNSTTWIKVDMGSYYYEGEIKQTYFPHGFLDVNSIVEKSLENYTSPTTTVLGVFEKPTNFDMDTHYVISIKIANEFYSEDKEVRIPMRFVKKEQMDYIQEKFEQYDTMIQNLTKENVELKKELKEINDYLDNEWEQRSKDEKVVDNKTKRKPSTK